MKESKILHLGCGNKKEPGAFGVDLNPYPGVDLVHNLDLFPYPLPDNHFEKVLAIDVLEHVDNLVGVMKEIYRVSKPDAEVVITGPYATSMDRHNDPTHRRGFTRLSFDYFIVGREHYRNYSYAPSTQFELKQFFYFVKGPNTLFRRFMMKWANTFPRFYEAYLPYLYPMDWVYFVLHAKK